MSIIGSTVHATCENVSTRARSLTILRGCMPISYYQNEFRLEYINIDNLVDDILCAGSPNGYFSCYQIDQTYGSGQSDGHAVQGKFTLFRCREWNSFRDTY